MIENQIDEVGSDRHSNIDFDHVLNSYNRPQISKSNVATDVKNIKIDNKLKLSKTMKDVETEIERKVRNYVTLEDKLSCNVKENPAFPTDSALVQLALKAYSNEKEQKGLPSGWQFLTAAWNSDLSNGYYGCAYFNKEHQQIVIAHRGTNSLNAVWNDLKGIVYTNFVAQMNSAATFTDMILSLINKFNENGAYLKLSFTGHSLGGWLAQVTTFTAKYLTTDEDSSDELSLIKKTHDGYHAHTVVFDSPGCKQMLKKLKSKYTTYRYGVSVNDVRISIKCLDITTYLSAPNRINCCNAHVGRLYRVFVNLIDKNTVENGHLFWRVVNLSRKALSGLRNLFTKDLRYTKEAHSINNIVDCFDPQTGEVKRDKDGKLDVQEVLNWPIIEGIIFSDSEYNDVIKWASEFENFRPPVNQSFSELGKIRYHTRNFDEIVIKLNVYSEIELDFLQGYEIRFFFPKYESVIFSVDTDDSKTVLNSAIQKLDSMKFQIDIDVQLFDPNVKPLDFISYVRQLNHFFPHLNQVKRSTKSFTFDLISEIFKTESSEYLSHFKQNSLGFDLGSFNLNQFLLNENSQVLLEVEKETAVGVLKIYKIFESIKANTKYGNDNSMFLDVKTILQLKQLSLSSILEQIKKDYLIVIANNENSEAAVDLLTEIFEKLNGNQKIKFILIVDSESGVDWASIVGAHERGLREGITLDDLSIETREEILQRKLINLQGHRVSLAQIMPELESLKLDPENDLFSRIISAEILMKLGNQEEISAGGELTKLGEIEDYYIGRTLNKNEKVIQLNNLKSSIDDIFAVAKTDKYFLNNDIKITDGAVVKRFNEWVLERDTQNVQFIILHVDEAENQFQDICEFYPNKSIHWLTRLTLGHKSVYKHEQSRLCPNGTDDLDWEINEIGYNENTKTRLYNEVSVDSIRDSIVTVVGSPGMGKTTFFTHLALRKKELHPFLWVVKIKMNTISWEGLPDVKKHLTKKLVIEFVAKILGLKSEFEMSLFEYCLYSEKVVLFLDAFDEVSPKHDSQIFGLLETLQTEMKLKQLWLSSRPYALKDERLMAGAICTLQGFDKTDQREFLLSYLRKKVGRSDFYFIISMLVDILPKDNNGKSMAGMPLILKLVAEYFQSEFEMHYKDDENRNTKFPLSQLNIYTLYEKVIERKIGLIYSEKCGIEIPKQVVDVESKKRHKTTKNEHKLLALVSCGLDSFVTDQKVEINNLIDGIDKGEEITGLISGVVNGVPQFIHATFAEHFASQFLIEQLIERRNTLERFEDLFKALCDLLKRDSEVVLSLFNTCLDVVSSGPTGRT